MAIKPILFNTKMVRAILDGRKDATRRIVKGFIPDDAVWGYTAFTPKGYISCRGTFADGYGEKFFKLPCESGDILYVRETWKKAPNGYYYYEDWQRNDIADVTKWKPSIHMPKEAARIWLKVTNVRVERLQKIAPQGAWKEGARCSCLHPVPDCAGNKTAFVNIWNSTIKKSDIDRYGWDANSYVWVIEFERCEKPEGV
ncbi:hypothetical protein [Bacteroides congonensis]|jgi:hypothetical protein|uniref:hypothetical protein n=1 Tax=Bacteroides congonensis TaxID=1871006 RepID=UPI002FD8F0D5